MTSTVRYALVPGVVLEPLGDHWAVFSPASGESHLVNDSSAAILEMFGGASALDAGQVIAGLALDAGLPKADVEPLVNEALRTFITAGLVRVMGSASAQATIEP